MSKKILFIVGSLRKGSFNRQLAKKAEEILEGTAQVDYLEYADVPFMNQDIEFPAPEAVSNARAKVMQADAVWIFTPEYNSQIPGVLKNLLDWISRPLSPGERRCAIIAGKPVTVSGAGGKSATAGCRKQLDALLEAMQMSVMKENETGIALGKEAFETGIYEMSAEETDALKAQAQAFIKFI